MRSQSNYPKFSSSKFGHTRMIAGQNTPKGLHNKAQGRERSERTLGHEFPQRLKNPNGVSQHALNLGLRT